MTGPPSPPPSGAVAYSRGKVAAWCVYDFANSTFSAVIVGTVFQVYYTSHVVGNDAGLGDLWWGRAISASMLAVALSSPVLGAVADLTGGRRILLASYTAVAVTAIALLVTVEQGDIVWGFVLIVVANFATEGGIVFYNAYLPELVPPDRLGRVSGWGFGIGYVGSMVGLALAVPLTRAGRFDAVWLMVAACFAFFSLPALIMLGPLRGERLGLQRAARAGLGQVRRVLGEALRMPELRRFLLAYFCYLNGVNTAIFFAGSFAATTFGLGQGDVIRLFFIVQLSAMVGALAMARPTDVLGPKRVVQLALSIWIGTILVFLFVEDPLLFQASCVFAGLGLGSIQAASRALMATLIPPGREDEFFGFYALCGKSSAPLGTLLFGLVSAATGNQRAAVAAIAVFFVLGAALLTRVQGGGPTAPRGS